MTASVSRVSGRRAMDRAAVGKAAYSKSLHCACQVLPRTPADVTRREIAHAV
jgi:hypothetical protein